MQALFFIVEVKSQTWRKGNCMILKEKCGIVWWKKKKFIHLRSILDKSIIKF